MSTDSGKSKGLVFRQATRPYFVELDTEGLCEYLRNNCSAEELTSFAADPDPVVSRVAIVCLALLQLFNDTTRLSQNLHDDDYFLVSMSEKAMWNIWFRSSTEECCELLQAAVQCICRNEFNCAEDLLDQILTRDPDFPEAMNQRAILYYLSERYPASILACHRTLALNPYHFGAAAGLGHNQFQLGKYEEAIASYHRALKIHPRMEGVRQAMRKTKAAASMDIDQIAKNVIAQHSHGFRLPDGEYTYFPR